MGDLLDHREAVCGQNLFAEGTAQDRARDRADRVGVPADVGGVQEGARGGVAREQRESHGDRLCRGDGCAHLLDEALQGRGRGVGDQLHRPARRRHDVRVGGPCAALGQGIDVCERLPQQGRHVRSRRSIPVDTHGHGRRHEGSRLEALVRCVRDLTGRPDGIRKGLGIGRRDRNADRGDAHRRAVRGARSAHAQRVLARPHALEGRLRGGAQQVERPALDH